MDGSKTRLKYAMYCLWFWNLQLSNCCLEDLKTWKDYKIGLKCIPLDNSKLIVVLYLYYHNPDMTSAFYAPNFEKVGDILVSACPYVCMYVCTYSCSRYRLETSCMDSSWKNSRRVFLVFPELSPLVKLRPFDKQGDEIL